MLSVCSPCRTVFLFWYAKEFEWAFCRFQNTSYVFQLVSFRNASDTFCLLVYELESRFQGPWYITCFYISMHCMRKVPYHACVIRCGHNLVAVQTSRSILVRDFLLLHNFSAAFIHLFGDYEFNWVESKWSWVQMQLWSCSFWQALSWQCMGLGNHAYWLLTRWSNCGEQVY